MNEEKSSRGGIPLQISIIVSTFVVSMWLTWPSASTSTGEYWGDLFTALGGTLVPLIIALVFATIAKAISHKSRFLFNLTVVFFLAALLLIGNKIYVDGWKENHPINISSSCPISIQMPQNARRVSVPTDGLSGVMFESVQSNGFSKFMCIEVSLNAYFPNLTILEGLQIQAAQEGVTDVLYLGMREDPIRHAKLIGRMEIEGVVALLEYRLFPFNNRIGMLITGSESSEYPSDSIKAVISSIGNQR